MNYFFQNFQPLNERSTIFCVIKEMDKKKPLLLFLLFTLLHIRDDSRNARMHTHFNMFSGHIIHISLQHQPKIQCDNSTQSSLCTKGNCCIKTSSTQYPPSEIGSPHNLVAHSVLPNTLKSVCLAGLQESPIWNPH